jgi:hypothetical protein
MHQFLIAGLATESRHIARPQNLGFKFKCTICTPNMHQEPRNEVEGSQDTCFVPRVHGPSNISFLVTKACNFGLLPELQATYIHRNWYEHKYHVELSFGCPLRWSMPPISVDSSQNIWKTINLGPPPNLFRIRSDSDVPKPGFFCSRSYNTP